MVLLLSLTTSPIDIVDNVNRMCHALLIQIIMLFTSQWHQNFGVIDMQITFVINTSSGTSELLVMTKDGDEIDVYLSG